MGRIYDIWWFAAGGAIYCGTPKGGVSEEDLCQLVDMKDVVERHRIQNVDEIDTLVDILASVIGILPIQPKYQIPLKVNGVSIIVIKLYLIILIIWQRHF